MIEVAMQILKVVNIFFIAYIIGYSTVLFASAVSGLISLSDNWEKKNLRNNLRSDFYIPISIIVPAHNEKKVIAATILSLLDLDYKLFEVIVVDDGSTDGTADKIISDFNMHQVLQPIRMVLPCQRAVAVYQTTDSKVPITLVRKPNGGKSDALNMGVNVARYPYFITVDADSALESISLHNIIIPVLENENVVAVGGVVRPVNDLKIIKGKLVRPTMPKKLLTCMQVMEYERSFLASRILFDQFNANLIISGAFGLFRKDIVLAVGGFDLDTVGEDMEIVMKLHAFFLTQENPYVMKYAIDAVCWTQAPETLLDIMRQRRRWHIGLNQSLLKYANVFLSFDNGLSSIVSFLYFLVYELFSPLIELLGLFATIMAMVVGLVNIPFMLAFYLIYTLFAWIVSLTAFFTRLHSSGLRVTGMDVVKAIFCCLAENTFLRLILMLVRTTALFGYRQRVRVWGEIQRQNVTID